MALTPDRQGYLGNLEGKTLPQLQELLARQQKLLSDRKLVETLSDKGERVQCFADRLQQIIKDRTSETKVSQFKSERKSGKHQSSCVAKFDVSDKNDEKTLDALVTRNEESYILLQHGDSRIEKSEGHPPDDDHDDVGELSSNLQGMEIGSRSQDGSIYSNSYERVIKRAAENTDVPKVKYLPNRSLKYPIEKSPSLHPSNQKQVKKKKPKPVEESAVNPPPYAHQSVKIISIEESVMLTQEQRERHKNLIAERAAQRLADQLGPKMDTYSTTSPDMQYRVKKTDNVDELYDSDDFPSDAENDSDD